MVKYNNTVFLVYDHERLTEREIVYAKFTEEDILNNKNIELISLSKPTCPISPYFQKWCESARNFILED